MTQAIHVRSATEADLPDLLALYQHLVPGDEAPEPARAAGILRLFLRCPGSAILLAKVGDIPVASSPLAVIPNLTRGGRPYGLIENVVTHADFRKRGLGTRLLDIACEKAWAADCYKIMLMTGSKRPETLAFYRAAGFESSKTGFQKHRIPARLDEERRQDG